MKSIVEGNMCRGLHGDLSVQFSSLSTTLSDSKNLTGI